MNIRQLKQVLKGLNGTKLVPMIHGHHGIGKSSVVKQITEELDIGFVDLRLGNMADAGDLTGLPDPVETEDGKVTSFLRPEWFPTEGKGIIFLDEINRANKQVLQAVFQLVLDKRINNHVLPEGWEVVAAGNPNTEDFIVTDFSDKAFLSRFIHLKLVPEVSEWFQYLNDTEVDSSIISFLTEQPELRQDTLVDFNFTEIGPSHRSWEFVDRVLKSKVPEELATEVISGLIGTPAAIAYVSFKKEKYTRLDWSDVLNNYEKVRSQVKEYVVPEKNRYDIINMLLKDMKHNMIEILKESEETKPMSEQQFLNIKQFLLDIPADMGYPLFYRLQIENSYSFDQLDSDGVRLTMYNKIGEDDDLIDYMVTTAIEEKKSAS